MKKRKARSVHPEMTRSAVKMAEAMKSPEPVVIHDFKTFSRYGGLYGGMKNMLPRDIRETTEAPVGLRLMENQKLVYNADNGYVMSLMGKDYAVVSHRETVDQVMSIFREQGLDIENCPTMLNINSFGRVINLRVMLNEMCATPADGKPIYGCFEFTNSLDGKTSVEGLFKAIRLICANGMTSSRELMSFKAMHSIGTLKGMDVAAELAKLADGFSKSVEFYDELIHERLNWSIMNQMLEQPPLAEDEKPKNSILEDVLGVSIAAGVKGLLTDGRYGNFTVPGINSGQSATLYDAFNAITGLAHSKPDFKARNRIEESALDFVDAYRKLK
jgi:hypothetical protein